VAARAAAATAAGDPVCVLSVRSGEADPDAVLGVMARASHHLAGSPDLSGIAVTGGATAVGLLAALGADAVDILEPLDAEVPLCRLVDGPAAGLLLVTKGGGLGAEDAFLRAAQRLIPEGS